jgi:hypothetical protein
MTQTYQQKVAIMAKAGSLEQIEIRDVSQSESAWFNCTVNLQALPLSIFILNSSLEFRVKPKTVTRTFVTPMPVTREWIDENPNSYIYLVYGGLESAQAVLKYDAHIAALDLGFMYKSKEDRDAAVAAMKESMKGLK